MGQGFGRVALVSGGSRGIGAATVRRLASDGWAVGFCHHHDEQSAVEVEKAASELGARVLAVQTDLTRAVEVTSWVSRAEERLGPVQALVSCAGITWDQPLAEADWRAVIDTNLDGVFHLCRAVLPGMMARRSGRIVTVSSVSGVYGDAGERGLSTARAGIVEFTLALASQTGRYGIRANAVAPGAHGAYGRRTDLTAIWPERTAARLTEAIALRRFASAAEAADRVAFLLSGAAEDITGTVVEVPSTIGWPIGSARALPATD